MTEHAKRKGLQPQDVVVFNNFSENYFNKLELVFFRDGKVIHIPHLRDLCLNISGSGILLPDEIGGGQNIESFIMALIAEATGLTWRILKDSEYCEYGLNGWCKIKRAFILE